MEPDIIRMYSSSPPPLDNGADDDEDDDFGEFGGFSDIGTSGIGFGAPDYSNSKEEFITTNHFMSLHDYCDNEDSLATFTSVKNGKDKDCTAELPKPTKELSDVSTNTSKEKFKTTTSGTSFVNLEDVKRTGEQKENPGKAEGFSSEGIRTDKKVMDQDQQIDTCNGEKLSCLEVLTNGFAALDSANPQGIDDLDSVSDSKGLKTTSTHSTELSLDSLPSPAEDFADFVAFTNKQTIHLEEPEHKICKVFRERETENVQENHVINRVAEQSIMKKVSSDKSHEYEGATFTEGEQVCSSETSLVNNEVGSNCEQDPTALEYNDFIIFSIPLTAESSVSTTENAENTGRRKYCEFGNGKELDLPSANDSLETESINFTKIQNPPSDPAEETDLGDLEDVKNGESSTEFLSCSDTNEDDFGDFGTVGGASPAFVNDTQESVNDLSLEEFSEQSAHFSEPSGELGDSGDTNVVLTVKQKSDQCELNQTLEYRAIYTNALSGVEIPPFEVLENGEKNEFGEFDSVPKPQDECSAFQDSDDFADFSSAGCNQAAEWNAFEDEQKESCCWAAFGDEQAADSHCTRETWQSYRTDVPLSVDSTAIHKTSSVALASFHGAAIRQESAPSFQTTLLSRLERIFEACFPSIPVLEIEEEKISLNLFLETDKKQRRTGESLANSGELMEVWTELQDIHDAYGLRYQWGGSHSNKKLLCSLGIDTRNILFTGNKKQPVIVPMYAAGLGMLEPTKEPLKPISAAEKIASLGQTTPVLSEMNTCASDQFQESLPPVQFDWSSSGLTNPLDASGGSTLLNLDFFGPVDDSSSSSTTTMPGVDPELYELTTAKLETSNASSKITDAFARLMSTVEKASTSTRKPKKEEHLSEEAAKVISSLPDLTFMHAKVLMFPATLTPSTSCQEKVD